MSKERLSEQEKRMHNAIIDEAEMEMRETEVGEECKQSRTNTI